MILDPKDLHVGDCVVMDIGGGMEATGTVWGIYPRYVLVEEDATGERKQVERERVAKVADNG